MGTDAFSGKISVPSTAIRCSERVSVPFFPSRFLLTNRPGFEKNNVDADGPEKGGNRRDGFILVIMLQEKDKNAVSARCGGGKCQRDGSFLSY